MQMNGEIHVYCNTARKQFQIFEIVLYAFRFGLKPILSHWTVTQELMTGYNILGSDGTHEITICVTS